MNLEQNELYTMIDEKFIDSFQGNHLTFMKKYYYKYYYDYCVFHHRKPLQESEFYRNMHRRRIKLYQLCCPYCRTMLLFVHDTKMYGKDSCLNYCCNCGRTSTLKNIINQISRYKRFSYINSIGLKTIKEQNPEKEDWLIGYDCYQFELIELASIIEIIFRDYFEALIYISNYGIENEYIRKIIKMHTGNDFMNIEKANNNFKKAFNIDLKSHLEKGIWNDLLDIVNIRNMVVHNNGMVDNHFKSTKSYERTKKKINGDLFKLERADINKYLSSVIYAVTIISNLYLEYYYEHQSKVIANHYFNMYPSTNEIKLPSSEESENNS